MELGSSSSAALTLYNDSVELDPLSLDVDDLLPSLPWEEPIVLVDPKSALDSCNPAAHLASSVQSSTVSLEHSEDCNYTILYQLHCMRAIADVDGVHVKPRVSEEVSLRPQQHDGSGQRPCVSRATGKVTKPRARTALASASKTSRKVPSPSRFCHICWRVSSDKCALYACTKYSDEANRCRKVECERCIRANAETAQGALADSAAMRAAQEGTRMCLHCTGKCPERAQCKIYAKSNARRRALKDERRDVGHTSLVPF
mmetsp:Transcript_5141/g.13811  ORF Transcript_5141/g.13811 Transcript_5141/m.13811 type:complete len:258 (+) Transcript_5141:692-1465(+)|eukprot:CAMPEP_0185836514 /NCGR_PEP_ID=MMETSP1353-20130828/9885_1 /TAXON_ID=1077150 /ORGANISM="Erythrolobus australicus, Strain CCMP3124" /LENGTH=257 /DNA_ID=CAMNT_0028535319 /DNA_START=665 /DNA_END=1438 /DNA_ORIENTATION=+